MKQHDYTEELFTTETNFNHLKLYFDGACGPKNPNGDMGYGWVIMKDKEVIAHGHGYQLYDGVNYTSNNIAEWNALCLGLQFVLQNGINYKKLLVYGDSKMVIMQANGDWKINVDKGYSTVAFIFLDKFKPFIKDVSYKWIPRENNGYCDELSKRYVQVTGTQLHPSDIKKQGDNKPLKYKKPKKVEIFKHSWDIKSAKFYETITCTKCGCRREYIKERFSDGYQIYTIDGEERLTNPNCIKQ